MQVQCGSCQRLLNIPPELLDFFLQHYFRCPSCHTPNKISVAPGQAPALPPANPLAVAQQQQAEMLARNRTLLQMQQAQTQFFQQQQKRLGMLGGGRQGPGAAPMALKEPDPPEEEVVFATIEDDVDVVLEELEEYIPSKLKIGVRHPDPVVETASLSATEPPDISYKVAPVVAKSKSLSNLQLESIHYACQRHALLLPGGERAGFFLGDGAGVGKGRTLAGLIQENVAKGRKRHLWLSIGNDLRFDSRRDLDDIGSQGIEIHPLAKLPYGRLDTKAVGVYDGVVFLTYSSLIASSDKGRTRLKQLIEWCGKDFDGLLLLDECHKAKNLVPESGSTPTRTGQAVLELQEKLPGARVVYCSATGASEPRNMGYMVRMGLWGQGVPAFPDFAAFLEAFTSRGMGALEVLAMDMKARGMAVCRTLSYHGSSFEAVHVPLAPEVAAQYDAAARFWDRLRAAVAHALDVAGEHKHVWRYFWATHQRFFRQFCMSAKVPELVRIATRALADGMCVVVGLQSTGESRTQEALERAGSDVLDDFVSGPRELLMKLIEDHYPMPPMSREQRRAEREARNMEKETLVEETRQARAAAQEAGRGRKRKAVVYNHDHSEESSSDSESESDFSEGSESSSESESSDEEESESEGEEDEEEEGGAVGKKQAAKKAKGDPAAAAEAGVSAPPQQSKEERAAEREKRRVERDAEEVKVKEIFLQAEARKEALLGEVAALDLPTNALDDIIDRLGGPDRVAEMTGRKGALVRVASGDPSKGVRWQARSEAAGSTMEMVNIAEKDAFMTGKKLVAVISEAASAGISLQADRRAGNQRRRVHMTLELPWSADKAIQQLGRTHRSNQSSAPQYKLLFTPLGGEKRFAATIAKRLECLGALTQGSRRATAGISTSQYNFESAYGRRSLSMMYRVLLGEDSAPPEVLPAACQPGEDGTPAPMTLRDFIRKAVRSLLACGLARPAGGGAAGAPGAAPVTHTAFMQAVEGGGSGQPGPVGPVKIPESERTDVPKFLNRILGLPVEEQNELFDFFTSTMEHQIAVAKKEGRYDEGIMDVRANRCQLAAAPEEVMRDAETGARAHHYCVELDRGMGWGAALGALEEARAELCQQYGGKYAALPGLPVGADEELEGDGEGEGAEEGGDKSKGGDKGKSKGKSKGKGKEKAEGGEGERAKAERPKGALGKVWDSFFYKSAKKVMGSTHVLLATERAGSEPRGFRITRPTVGSTRSEVKLHDLRNRYVRCEDLAEAARLWGASYRISEKQCFHGANCKRGATCQVGKRVQEMHVLGGVVLPLWDVVQKGLLAQKRQSERRLRLVRVTADPPEGEGGEARRVVGIHLPLGAVEEVLAKIKAPE